MKFLKESQFKDELKDLDNKINFYKGKVQALNDYADKHGFDDILPSGRTVEEEIQYYSIKQASAIDKKAELEKPRKKVVKDLFQDKFEEDLNEALGIKNESSNQLKDMAKHNKKKQKGKGWFVKLNAGNPEYNASFFNRAMGNDTTSSSEISNSEGTGLAEDLKDNINNLTGNIEVDFYTALNGHTYALEYMEDLQQVNPKLLGKLLYSIEIFKNEGYTNTKFSKYLKDGIYEIRASQSTNEARVLYFFIFGNKIILTNGYTKKQDKLDKSAFEKSKALMNEYHNREVK